MTSQIELGDENWFTPFSSLRGIVRYGMAVDWTKMCVP